jgi:uncharacterized protein
MLCKTLCSMGTIEAASASEVEVPPDQALVSLTVLSQAATAANAVAANALATQAVLKAVAAEPHHRLMTTGLGVAPITAINPITKAPTIVGFRATNTVEIATAPLDAGRVYDVGVKAGASRASGVSFSVQDPRAQREEALRRATKRAYAEARVVAETAAGKLDGAKRIEIKSSHGPVGFRALTAAGKAAASPVIPGDLSVSAGVRLVLRTRS